MNADVILHAVVLGLVVFYASSYLLWQMWRHDLDE